MLGDNIRRLRIQQRKTLQDVATACGFTKSLLSKIEHGKSVPPVATLVKIAEALGVQMSVLLDESAHIGTILTTSEALRDEHLSATDTGYWFKLIAADRPGKIMQPFLFVARKGQIRSHKLSHAGEEFVFVLSGSMKYRVGEVEYHLGAGDSLYFDAHEEHEVTPTSDEVRYMAVFATL